MDIGKMRNSVFLNDLREWVWAAEGYADHQI